MIVIEEIIVIRNIGEREVMAMKKAVFFDVDGTLLDSARGISTISNGVKKAIRDLQDKGNLAFIASGRPYAFLSSDILDFGFDGYVLMNGSLVMLNDNNTAYSGDKTLYKHPIEKIILKELIADFEKFNIEYILQDEKYSYMNDEFKGLKDIYDNLGISYKYIKNDYSLDDINIYKLEMYCPDSRAEQYLKSLEDRGFRYTYFPEFNLFELYFADNTKATGIKKALDHLNIDIRCSYAFGDSGNDVEMLKTVSCGIVMGNATDEIKEHGDRVTKAVSEDGVAYGIEKYILA